MFPVEANNGIRILRYQEVSSLLCGSDRELMDVIETAYLAHATGKTTLPHSTFLRFPNGSSNRIIALPAYMDCGARSAGLKWIASFPRNTHRGLDRASAVIVLNSVETGRPLAILEASLISAKRTAASAAIAAERLHAGRPVRSMGFVGCGLINFETAQFLRVVFPELADAVVLDNDPDQAQKFRGKLLARKPHWNCQVVRQWADIVKATDMISIATTASAPHIDTLADCKPRTTILHISLRDIAPRALLECDNITDDVDHVCREGTSLHLAEGIVGHRQFIRATLGEILQGKVPAHNGDMNPVVFSPFGLGVLDLGVGQWIAQRAAERGIGTIVESFLPEGQCW